MTSFILKMVCMKFLYKVSLQEISRTTFIIRPNTLTLFFIIFLFFTLLKMKLRSINSIKVKCFKFDQKVSDLGPSILLSFSPSFHPGVFLELAYWFSWKLDRCYWALWSYASQPEFLKKMFLPQKLWKWVRRELFEFYENFKLFSGISLKWKFILFTMLLDKSRCWEKFGTWDMDHHSLSAICQ